MDRQQPEPYLPSRAVLHEGGDHAIGLSMAQDPSDERNGQRYAGCLRSGPFRIGDSSLQYPPYEGGLTTAGPSHGHISLHEQFSRRGETMQMVYLLKKIQVMSVTDGAKQDACANFGSGSTTTLTSL